MNQELRSIDADFGQDGAPSIWLSRSADRRAFIEDLRREFDPGVLSFALSPDGSHPVQPGSGCNHTAALLATAGSPYITTDDDVFARTAILKDPQGEREPQILTLEHLPAEIRYFPDRAGTVADVLETDIDIVESHLSVLGDSDVFGPVPISTPGSYGHSGMGGPRTVLTLRGEARNRVYASESAYETLKLSTEVTRILHPGSVTFFHDYGVFHDPPGSCSRFAPDRISRWDLYPSSLMMMLVTAAMPFLPAAWARDVDLLLDNIHKTMQAPALLFGKSGCGLEPARFKEALGRYAELLILWPALWESRRKNGAGRLYSPVL